jgi:general secretion pathway protein D
MDELTPDSLTYHTFLELLQSRGFVAVPSGDVTTIVPNVFVRTLPTPIVSVDDIAGDDAEVVTIIIPVKNGDAVQLATTLRPMVASYGYLNALPDQNALLMVDRVANVKRIAAIVRSKGDGR